MQRLSLHYGCIEASTRYTAPIMKPPRSGRHNGPPHPATDRPRRDQPQGRPSHGQQAQGHPSKSGHQPQGARFAPPARPAGDPERPRLSLAPSAPRPDAERAPQREPQGHRPRHQPHHPPRVDPDAPRGAFWLYGHHAVAAALANRARRARRLLLTEEAEASLAARLPQPWPLGHERVDRARLDQLLGRDAVHQGIALLVDPLPPPSLAQTLERPGPVLVLDQVTDPRNVGAILRCAAAFRAAGVIVQDRNAPEETGALAKAASGALEAVPLLRAVNIARTLIALKAANCWVVGLAANAAPLSGPALAERRVALVLGAEGEGMRRLTRETCDELAGLAMGGDMESLNVSAAAAVALYELGRT
jgi:23S rRNA (guanosine2251-2'-O)-methyltransferase